VAEGIGMLTALAVFSRPTVTYGITNRIPP